MYGKEIVMPNEQYRDLIAASLQAHDLNPQILNESLSARESKDGEAKDIWSRVFAGLAEGTLPLIIAVRPQQLIIYPDPQTFGLPNQRITHNGE